MDDEDSNIAADNDDDGIIPKNSAKKTAMEEGAEGEGKQEEWSALERRGLFRVF